MALLKLGPGSVASIPWLRRGSTVLRITKRVPIRGLSGSGAEAERVLHSTREPGFNDELGEARDAENEETTGHFGAGPE